MSIFSNDVLSAMKKRSFPFCLEDKINQDIKQRGETMKMLQSKAVSSFDISSLSCNDSDFRVHLNENKAPKNQSSPINNGQTNDNESYNRKDGQISEIFNDTTTRTNIDGPCLGSLELSTSDLPKETESSSSSPPSSLPKTSQFGHLSIDGDDQGSRKSSELPFSISRQHNSCDDTSRITQNSSISNAGSDDPVPISGNGFYSCHICSYSGNSHAEFKSHLQTHYDYHCDRCDYTSRTEGRLKRHIKDFHCEVPPENFSGKCPRFIKPKVQKCKQCDFNTTTKEEFWEHQRIHIKSDRMLECDKCCFVTEYKHHLEYHMRNHTGSKPYKCNKCNYECVNKSMLNSHMKSHTNVYQYRCVDCNYATKYCHSLKLHLQKLSHKPDVVLNSDGSLPEYDNSHELMSIKRGPNAHSNPSYKSKGRQSRKKSLNTDSLSNGVLAETGVSNKRHSTNPTKTTLFPHLQPAESNPINSIFHQQLMKMTLNMFMQQSKPFSEPSLSSFSPFNEHLASVTDVVLSNQCKICFQTFPNIDDLLSHLGSHMKRSL